MAIHIRLAQFDGPLDLLLHLIDSAKVNIKDIFVSEITDQYIESVQNAEDLDMDDASEFLAMAALLLEIKSRSLLPKPPKLEEDEEDPAEVLIRRLEEYRRFKETASNMQAFEKAAAAMYQKLPEEYPLPPQSYELTGLTLDGLVSAFLRIYQRRKAEEDSETLASRAIRKDVFSVEECITYISAKLKKGPVPFDELFTASPTKEEVVTLFLALLELLRLSRAYVEQQGIFDPILILPGRRPD